MPWGRTHEARAHRLDLSLTFTQRLSKKGRYIVLQGPHTREIFCRQRVMDVWSMTWSSALNWLKGRENEIQAPDEEEEEHFLPLSPHTDKPRAPHFSSRLNPPLWLLLGRDWPWPLPTTLSPARTRPPLELTEPTDSH